MKKLFILCLICLSSVITSSAQITNITGGRPMYIKNAKVINTALFDSIVVCTSTGEIGKVDTADFKAILNLSGGGPGSGISSLNTLTASTQTFAVGTSGSDFNISSLTATHTFNIPDAGASARGLVTTGTQTLAGAKTFSSDLTIGTGKMLGVSTNSELRLDNSVGAQIRFTNAKAAFDGSGVHLFGNSGSFTEQLTVQGSGSGFIGIYATSPTSTLQVVGSFATKYNSTATGIVLDGTYHTVEVTATGQTITLPTAVGITGREYTIKLTASGSCTVATTSSQNIDASTTYSLSAQYKYVTVQSNGANWIVIANN